MYNVILSQVTKHIFNGMLLISLETPFIFDKCSRFATERDVYGILGSCLSGSMILTECFLSSKLKIMGMNSTLVS